jgi:hypothetical protein
MSWDGVNLPTLNTECGLLTAFSLLVATKFKYEATYQAIRTMTRVINFLYDGDDCLVKLLLAHGASFDKPRFN